MSEIKDEKLKDEIPKQIMIGDFKYTFKKSLTNDNYSYRCIHRKCPVLMTISKSELYKLNSKTSSLEINVVYINEHNLDAHKKIKEVKENSNIININKSNKDLGSQLIKGSLNKPLEWISQIYKITI